MLPLDTLRPCWREPIACAVLQAGQVLVASPLALALGVRAGMRQGGVAAIAPDTCLLERDLLKEDLALGAIAMALLQYTPEVALADDFSILMDVSASLRLFGGPLALCQRVRASLAALGVHARLGAAPTAKGAWLLARHGRRKGVLLRRRLLSLPTLAQRLDALPYHLLPTAAPHAAWLDGIGAHNLGALRRLPRQGLLRRTSKQLLGELDCAYGELSELFDWIKVPSTFAAQVETMERIEQAEALLHGATSLIVQMTGWLVARQLAVTMFTLSLQHERGRCAVAPTTLDIVLAEPAWHDAHLLRLLKERLAKLTLTAPVIGLRLEARQLQPMQPPTDSLFPEPGGKPEDFHRLLELLAARLGPDNVLAPASRPDHRPEVCNAWLPATNKPVRKSDDEETVARPFWLLPKPIALLMRQERPFYGSPLRLIAGPERIEAGWWNDQMAARDYYVAQGNDASCYWIYLERSHSAEQRRWFLHGLYA